MEPARPDGPGHAHFPFAHFPFAPDASAARDSQRGRTRTRIRIRLVDADEANTSVSWQWVAGCGADASPYFRSFNPEARAAEFDPDGR